MNVYFNTEYTGTYEDARLISLGCIAENGKKLYIEFLDVPSYLANAFVQSDVYPDTYIYSTPGSFRPSDEKLAEGMQAAKDYDYQYYVACRGHVGTLLHMWFKELLSESENADERILLISYCCQYDAVLLLNLFNGDIPVHLVYPYCYDILHDVMFYVNFNNRKLALSDKLSNTLNTNFKQFAFDYFHIDEPNYPKEHALYSAEIVKRVFDRIYNS